MTAFPHLLRPIQIGKTLIRNRVIMGSMHVGLEDRPWHSQKLAAYLARRAEGGVGLIITGGVAPNFQGRLTPFGTFLKYPWQMGKHKTVTKAVHAHGAKIALQILHAGRYGFHPFIVSASASKATMTPFKARELSVRGIEQTIDDFTRSAELAIKAGYDGVEVMGSEGYFLNQFLTARTNRRQDQFGGDIAARARLPFAIVEKIKARLGDDCLLIYRTSILELVGGGNRFDEILWFAKGLEDRGVDLLTSGIGWHEALIPTISTLVPHAAFTDVTALVRSHIKVPIVATNRINTPEIAEQILASGKADMVALARPFLADPDFVNKAAAQRSSSINVCIACNQACLDHIFVAKRATCLVNPFAAYETERKLLPLPVGARKRLAVIGGGISGLAFAHYASSRGHTVELFEKAAQVGGQFLLAARIPGKADYMRSIQYFSDRLREQGVNIHLQQEWEGQEAKRFDEIVIAAGVLPRRPRIQGIEHPMVVDYASVLRGDIAVGHNIAIIGAGGVGFDVAEFVCHHKAKRQGLSTDYFATWGIDPSFRAPGGLLEKPNPLKLEGKVYLLQRKPGRLGKTLNKTTGWALRRLLQKYNVQSLSGLEYVSIAEAGLTLRLNEMAKKSDESHLSLSNQADSMEPLLKVDQIIICAGSESNRLAPPSHGSDSKPQHFIGGAKSAQELNAKLAILDAFELANKI